jgi:hypothetical protein
MEPIRRVESTCNAYMNVQTRQSQGRIIIVSFFRACNISSIYTQYEKSRVHVHAPTNHQEKETGTVLPSLLTLPR